MSVDQTSLDRIRNATFPASRRGYDKREVEKFLNRLADWLETGGGDQARSDTVKKELERVGQRTGAILAQAEESAQSIRDEAEGEAQNTIETAKASAQQTREEADAYANQTRTAADGYASQTRQGADQYAEDKRRASDEHAAAVKAKSSDEAEARIEAAKQQARRIVEEGVKRRRDIESVISDLVRRRDDVLKEAGLLSEALVEAIKDHRPTGADPFATPDELDPGATIEPEEPEEADEALEAAREPEGGEAEGAESDEDAAATGEQRAKRGRRGKGDGRSRKRGARIKA